MEINMPENELPQHILTAAAFLRRWMQQVMDERRWNAQEWASKAGTTPTNITRFLKGSEHVPSYTTLVKLAVVAGMPIPTPGLAQREIPKVRIPLLKLEQVRGERSASVQSLVKRARKDIVADWAGPRAFAVRLDHSRFAEIGYVTGDVLVIDPDVGPAPGKHVLVTNGSGTGPCRYEPPFVYCAEGKKKVKIDTITIIGTIVELIRRMT
jgi:transcriptional regulator with XRE-family HTH domain